MLTREEILAAVGAEDVGPGPTTAAQLIAAFQDSTDPGDEPASRAQTRARTLGLGSWMTTLVQSAERQWAAAFDPMPVIGAALADTVRRIEAHHAGLAVASIPKDIQDALAHAEWAATANAAVLSDAVLGDFELASLGALTDQVERLSLADVGPLTLSVSETLSAYLAPVAEVATDLRDRIALDWSGLDRIVQPPESLSEYAMSVVTPDLFGVTGASSALARMNASLGRIGEDASAALVRMADVATFDFSLAERLPGLTALGDSAAAMSIDLLARLGDVQGLANALAPGIPLWEDWGWSLPDLAPGTPEGDFLLIQRTDGDPDERLAAMERVATRMRRIRHLRRLPALSRELLRQAEERKVPVDDILTTEVAAAMVLVLGSDTQPQTVRLGRGWIKDKRGKKAVFAPEQLDVWSYREWFEISVARTARRSLLDRPDVLLVGQSRPIEERSGLVVPLLEGVDGDEIDVEDPQADNPLDLLVADSDHSERCRRLAAVLDLATPRQRQILELLALDFTNAEIAVQLGITEATVRVQRHRLHTKACAKGLAA